MITNTIKLIGECAVPGTSQLLDGNITSGVVHVAVGLAARALLSLPGVILVAANSYAQSVANKGVYDYVKQIILDTRPRVEEAPTTPQTAEEK